MQSFQERAIDLAALYPTKERARLALEQARKHLADTVLSYEEDELLSTSHFIQLSDELLRARQDVYVLEELSK